MTLEQLSWFVDDVVKRQLQGLKDVGRIDRIGGVSREIQITLDPDRLMSLGITRGRGQPQLRATNVDLGGGRSEFGGQEQAIRTLAGARTVESLRRHPDRAAGRPRGPAERPGRGDRRLRGAALLRQAGRQPAGRLLQRLPLQGRQQCRCRPAWSKPSWRSCPQAHPDVSYTLIDDTVSYIDGNYEAAMGTLLEGAALAVIVVFIFLRDWRATLITAVAMPLSIIPTFWVMHLMGFSLNLVSLLAITLVTGILVDDAIVEIENIVRHMRMGKSPYRAAMEAADEIGLAVIATTLTIVAIFAPVSFMGGIPGQYFKQFGLTVAVAVLFSLLVARLITPMMAAYLMQPHPARPERDGAADAGLYRVPARHPALSAT